MSGACAGTWSLPRALRSTIIGEPQGANDKAPRHSPKSEIKSSSLNGQPRDLHYAYIFSFSFCRTGEVEAWLSNYWSQKQRERGIFISLHEPAKESLDFARVEKVLDGIAPNVGRTVRSGSRNVGTALCIS